MKSSHKIPHIEILCILIGVIQQVRHSLGKGERVDDESTKNNIERRAIRSKTWCSSHKFFYALFSVTQFFLLGF